MTTALALAIASPAGAAQVQQKDKQPIYTVTVNVVDRTTKAINYQHRDGATKIDFRGTALLPESNGEAKVESKKGYTEIEVEFDKLQSATRFGPEYLTYVMWAITPEGRATNLGEVILDDSRSKLDVTTELQSFGLVVTAEPYFGVTQPSDVVVMENEIRSDTKGTVEQVEAKYELLQRGLYESDINPADMQPMKGGSKTPLELYEARNAVRIARWTGAEQYASDTFKKAQASLQNAESLQTGSGDKKAEISVAREAVQTSEDARVITVKKMDDERQANERQDSADSVARAGERTDRANRQRDKARSDTAQAQSDTARAQSDTAQAKSDTAQAQSDMARNQERNADDQRNSADAQARSREQADDATRQKELAQSETAQAKSDRAQDQATSANAVAAARADADQSRSAAQLSDQRAQSAENDKAAMRARLEQQLNSILQTRDSARGLIVSMSDVLFDTGKYSLLPGAREKLAKVAGILLAYPGLNIAVGGYTDNVGSNQLNQNLSEQRAGSVRDYLVQQGVARDSVTATGFGNSVPVASNNNAAGRQANRRVELVVSGEAIGTQTTRTSGNLQ
ncbi:MAG TPA: OmpA family protein [Candidatus Angelobacter sp.]|jgi:outer membrane protein OmpA-like peptidoglycan-associated protein|nr:OmpA family protein [Candidatus Angelobacter sp.]